ncbi:hypothetical protein BGX34_002176 [Mortierella sp. NVP85]|nr:hypothetical protein BGX34_002176 [Mortierella sp. NVP85]
MKDESFNEILPRRVAFFPDIMDVIVGENRASEATKDTASDTDTVIDSAKTTVSGRGLKDQDKSLYIRLSSGSNTDSHSPSSNVAIFAVTKINTSDNNRLSVGRE